MRITAVSAALAPCPPSLRDRPEVVDAAVLGSQQTQSPAARYAIAAIEALDSIPENPALFVMTGPLGSTLHSFDRARHQNGQLTAPGFAGRSRRIHPFTLLLSMQNQVAGTLSMHFGWTASCFTLCDSPRAFADIIVNFRMASRDSTAIVVLTSAAGRDEDASWHATIDDRPVIEGGIALVSDPGASEIGQVHLPDECGSSHSRVRCCWPKEAPRAPYLEPGLAILGSLDIPDVQSFRVAPGNGPADFLWRTA